MNKKLPIFLFLALLIAPPAEAWRSTAVSLMIDEPPLWDLYLQVDRTYSLAVATGNADRSAMEAEEYRWLRYMLDGAGCVGRTMPAPGDRAQALTCLRAYLQDRLSALKIAPGPGDGRLSRID